MTVGATNQSNACSFPCCSMQYLTCSRSVAKRTSTEYTRAIINQSINRSANDTGSMGWKASYSLGRMRWRETRPSAVAKSPCVAAGSGKNRVECAVADTVPSRTTERSWVHVVQAIDEPRLQVGGVLRVRAHGELN